MASGLLLPGAAGRWWWLRPPRPRQLQRQRRGFGGAGPPAAPPTTAARSERRLAPVILSKGEGFGRGLLASRAFAAGEPLLEEQPVVSHPRLAGAGAGRICYHCLQSVGAGQGVEHRGRCFW